MALEIICGLWLGRHKHESRNFSIFLYALNKATLQVIEENIMLFGVPNMPPTF
ncbi:MAG: hypothetical protein ACTS8W_00810 [Arsenophonus sp. NC-PY1-MAG3]